MCIFVAVFLEREENVKSDIFHAFIALLKATRSSDDLPHNPDSMEQVSGPIALLQDQVPDIIKAIQPLMREKSVKTRQDCFLLLRELLTALPGALSNHLEQLMPGIHYSLSDKNSTSNMKIDALNFLCNLLQGHNPQVQIFNLIKISKDTNQLLFVVGFPSTYPCFSTVSCECCFRSILQNFN